MLNFKKETSQTLLEEAFDRKDLRVMNEASQTVVAESLVNLLFKHLKEKHNEFNNELIAKSEGRVTKLKTYNYLQTAIAFLEDLVTKENNEEMISEVNILKNTLANLEKFQLEFKRAYDTGNNLAVMVYESILIGLLTSTSNLLAYGLDYVRDHKMDHLDAFTALNKKRFDEITAYTANLNRFNTLSNSGEMARFLKASKAQNETLSEDVVTIVGLTIGVISIFFVVLYTIRTIIYMYFKVKQDVSDYMKYLAEFTRLNIETLDPNADKTTIKKQEASISRLNQYSKYFDVSFSKANKAVNKEIKIESKEDYKQARTPSDDLKTDGPLDDVDDMLL